jgi:hypothetical protein
MPRAFPQGAKAHGLRWIMSELKLLPLSGAGLAGGRLRADLKIGHCSCWSGWKSICWAALVAATA